MSRLDFPPDDDRSLDLRWWAPLEAVGRVIAGEPRYRFFDLGDFMVMARVVRRPRRPDVLLYKHRDTRRYLNLDDTGHAYRYVPPGENGRGTGRYVRHRDLLTALDHLKLWELPRMKPNLDEHRLGLAWDDSRRLYPDANEREEHRRSRLRVVRLGDNDRQDRLDRLPLRRVLVQVRHRRVGRVDGRRAGARLRSVPSRRRARPHRPRPAGHR